MSLIIYNSDDIRTKNEIKDKYGLDDNKLAYPFFVPNTTIICDTKGILDNTILDILSTKFKVERLISTQSADVCVGDDDKPLDFKKSTITITYGDVAENHAGMQKIGNMADSGLTMAELRNAQSKLQEFGIKSDIYIL